MPSYPIGAVRRVADELMEQNYNLPDDEAMDLARDVVIDVTIAVDKLREIEATNGVA